MEKGQVLGREEDVIMEKQDLADEKRRLNVQVAQSIREFEQKTGLEVTGIKIKRDEQGIESVSMSVTLPD